MNVMRISLSDLSRDTSRGTVVALAVALSVAALVVQSDRIRTTGCSSYITACLVRPSAMTSRGVLPLWRLYGAHPGSSPGQAFRCSINEARERLESPSSQERPPGSRSSRYG